MNLSSEQSYQRLAVHEHGVLATLHADRGADLVPVVFIVVEGHVGVPIDLVKPKASVRLQRVRNLESDPRATLLVEFWDREDWSALWWVRAELRWLGDGVPPSSSDLATRMADQLTRRHAQYHDRPFARLLVFRIEAVTGWTAEA
jgi:hypothetical protein